LTENDFDLEKIKHTDKLLFLVLIILLSLFLLLIFSKDMLERERLTQEYNKLSEFLDNQIIFHKYLDLKRDLYSELNKTSWDSSGEYEKYGEYKKYNLSMSLFSGIRGPWGWDTLRLDNKYNYSEIMIDAFINDFSFWKEKDWSSFKLFDQNEKTLPDSVIRDFYDMERRVRLQIKNDDFVNNFFANNLEIKMKFFKDILQKYSISLPDSFSSPLLVKIRGFDLNDYVIEYLNDSTRSMFNLNGLNYMKNNILNSYRVNETYDLLCKNLFDTYIKNKFTLFDPNMFNNKLPYSSYVDKMRNLNKNYESSLAGVNILYTTIESPLVKIKLDLKILFRFVFWVVFILGVLTNNIIKYRESIFSSLNIKPISKKLSKHEFPSFFNLLFLNFRNKNLIIKLSFHFIQLVLIGSILFGINLYYYDIIYSNTVWFILLGICPIVLIIGLNITTYWNTSSKKK
jgi:hypothetical protein